MLSVLAVLVMVVALVAAAVVDEVEVPDRPVEWPDGDGVAGARATVTVLSTASHTGGAASGCWSGGLTEGGQQWV